MAGRPSVASARRERDETGSFGRRTGETIAPGVVPGPGRTGTVCSSRRALLAYFRRTHQCHREPDDALYRTVALRLRELKRAASGPGSSDMVVWFALYDRLRDEGVDADWLLGHVELRCPRCHGRLKYHQVDAETIHAECATNCTDDHAERLGEIERLAADLVHEAFGPEGPRGTDGSETSFADAIADPLR